MAYKIYKPRPFSLFLIFSLLLHGGLVGVYLFFLDGPAHLIGDYSSSGVFQIDRIFLPGRRGEITHRSKKQNLVKPALTAPAQTPLVPGAAPRDLQPAQPDASEGLQSIGGGQAGAGGRVNDDRLQRIRLALEKAKRYPVLAKRRGDQGVTRIRFRLDSTGYPLEVVVVDSSGSKLLDGSALDTVKRAAPYPYVSGWLTFPMRYNLVASR